MSGGLFKWLPWTRRATPEQKSSDIVHSFDGGATIEQLGDVQAACRLYGTVLATAAPGDGPLTPWLLFDCGFRLGLRGKWQAVIEVGPDGRLKLTPFDAWPDRGVWIGSTRERDGRDSRNLSVPADAVFRIELPGGSPVSLLSSTASLAYANEWSLGKEVGTVAHNVFTTDIGLLNSPPETRDEISESIDKIMQKAGGPPVLPAGVFPGARLGPQPSAGQLQLREQLRLQVEAHFGIMGLLSEMDGTAVHALWRVAVVRTFDPLARLVEMEAADKLDSAYTLNRDAWIAAPHSELARATAQRATAVQRLTAAGVEVDTAREAVGL